MTPEMMENEWSTTGRWTGIHRPYSAQDVLSLQGQIQIQYTLATLGSQRLWDLMQTQTVRALGAMSGNQAAQQVRAGLLGIYASGWQVAADANLSGETYPDMSLYPANSMPALVRRINNALTRADQVGEDNLYWHAPIVADAEAGFGGNLNVFELVKSLIEAGVSGIHLEDQLSSAKKCGHMGGKVLVPTNEFVKKLIAARLATDVLGVPTVLIARTDADSAKLLTSDVDPRDQEFTTGDRTSEGFFRINGGIQCAIARGLAYAPYSDLIWCETSHPDLGEAKQFADAIHDQFPNKMLAYNCSPSFNWKKNLDDTTIAKFQNELSAMGYKFQFVTLAGFHALNSSMFNLALDYRDRHMAAYIELQEKEFADQDLGYGAVTHQKFVGAGYFDKVSTIISKESETTSLKDSTEEEQF